MGVQEQEKKERSEYLRGTISMLKGNNISRCRSAFFPPDPHLERLGIGLPGGFGGFGVGGLWVRGNLLSLFRILLLWLFWLLRLHLLLLELLQFFLLYLDLFLLLFLQ